MSNGRQRFAKALAAHGAANYEERRAYATVTVSSLDRDSAGGILSATGQIDGQGSFTVPLRGVSAAVGDRLLVAYPQGQPAGAELTYVRHEFSDNVAAGFLDTDADLPAPTFAAIPATTDLDASTTAIDSYIVVYFIAVEARYRPSSYVVSYRQAGGSWTDQGPVPHLGGTQPVRLGSNFIPGTFVDVKLRTVYNWAQAQSVPTAAITVQAALDDASPGAATALNVSTTTPGALILQATGTVDTNLFLGWRYEVATSSGGAGLQISPALPGPWTVGLAPGNYYVAARPVSRSGTLGTRYPGTSSFLGPYTVAGAFAPDITPPPTWAAPLLSIARNQPATGGEEAILTITLPTSPAYAFPADYQQTIARILSAGVYSERIIPHGVAAVSERVNFGTTTVTLQGEDTSGNRSAASPSASVSLAATGVPAIMPDVTTVSISEAVRVNYVPPANTLTVKVWRATSSGGAGAAIVGATQGNFYLDLFIGAGAAGTVYYYKAQATNLFGDGTISPTWVAGTVGAVDGANLVANSVTANTLEASLNITGKTIQTNSSGARVALEGASNRLAVYDAGPLLRAILQAAGVYLVQDSGFNRMALTRDGLTLYQDDSTVRRMFLSGSGLEFFNDAGAVHISMGIDGAANGYLANVGGFTIRGPYAELDMSAAQYMAFPWTMAANNYQNIVMTRMISGGDSFGFGFAGYRVTPGGVAPARFVFSYTADPLNRTTNYGGIDYVQIEAGTLYANSVIGGSSVWVGTYQMEPFSDAFGAGVDFNNNAIKTRDVVAIRDGGTTGVIFLGNQSGGARYLYYDGTSYQMPGANLVLNTVTITSDRGQKANIRDAGTVGEALDQIPVRRYTRTNDPDEREHIGLVADEVRAAGLGELVLPAAQVFDGPEVDDGPPEDTGERDQNGAPIMRQPKRQPMQDAGESIDLYGLASATLGVLQETRQALAALTARVTALEAGA